MPYNNSRNYNTRNSGRFNRPGSFVPASSTNPQNHQPYRRAEAVPKPPEFDEFAAQPPSVPILKAEEDIVMNSDALTPAMDDDSSSTRSTSRMPFFKTKLSGVKKISNKERRRRQNALLRRLTSPKNALMCINEMLPNEQIANQFKVEPAPQDNQYFNNGGHNFCAELMLDGVSYKGYGENKLIARNAAAEQAIRDIVLKKMERYSEIINKQPETDASAAAGTGTGTGTAAPAPGPALDSEGGEALPMIQLLSFALHKLFAEWEGAGHHVPHLRPRHATQVKEEEMSAPAAAAPTPPGNKPRPPKKVPENASSMHPAMLLTMLRPHACYRELGSEGDRPQNMTFTVAVDTDDQTFVGKASNKKEARKMAARAACKTILGITFDDEKSGISTIASK